MLGAVLADADAECGNPSTSESQCRAFRVLNRYAPSASLLVVASGSAAFRWTVASGHECWRRHAIYSRAVTQIAAGDEIRGWTCPRSHGNGSRGAMGGETPINTWGCVATTAGLENTLRAAHDNDDDDLAFWAEVKRRLAAE